MDPPAFPETGNTRPLGLRVSLFLRVRVKDFQPTRRGCASPAQAVRGRVGFFFLEQAKEPVFTGYFAATGAWHGRRFRLKAQLKRQRKETQTMNLIRFHRTQPWPSPAQQLDTLRDEINRLFEAPFHSLFGDGSLLDGWSPALDVHEDKDHLTVRIELPGMNKNDIDLSLHENTLTVAGERKAPETEPQATVTRAERYFGRFQRTLTLPKPVDADGVKAQYKDGILTVTLPKTEESKPRQIDVKAA